MINFIYITLISVKTYCVISNIIQAEVIYIYTTFSAFLVHTQLQSTGRFTFISLYINIYSYSMERLVRFVCIFLRKEIGCCDVAAEILIICTYYMLK